MRIPGNPESRELEFWFPRFPESRISWEIYSKNVIFVPFFLFVQGLEWLALLAQRFAFGWDIPQGLKSVATFFGRFQIHTYLDPFSYSAAKYLSHSLVPSVGHWRTNGMSVSYSKKHLEQLVVTSFPKNPNVVGILFETNWLKPRAKNSYTLKFGYHWWGIVLKGLSDTFFHFRFIVPNLVSFLIFVVSYIFFWGSWSGQTLSISPYNSEARLLNFVLKAAINFIDFLSFPESREFPGNRNLYFSFPGIWICRDIGNPTRNIYRTAWIKYKRLCNHLQRSL